MNILFEKYIFNKETKELEFKQFSIKKDLNKILTKDQIDNIIINGKWSIKFNKLIYENLYLYFEMYIPKYVAQFINEQIEGILIIGIDDSGKITGIPSKTKLSKKKICKDIRNILEKDNIFRTSNSITNIIRNIKISIKKLIIDESLLNDDALILYNTYINNIKNNEENLILYKIKYNKWLEIYDLYRTRLNDIINNNITRKELIDYIISNTSIDNNLDNINIYILMLQSEIYIDIKKMCNYSVYSYKYDKNHLSYWVCEFQQHMLDKLLKIKPIKPIKHFKNITPDIILSKLTDLTYKFVKNNIYYYIIEIKINTSKHKKLINDVKILHNGKYVYIRRSMYNGEPYTNYCEINTKINIIIIINIIILIILMLLILFFTYKIN